MPWFDKISQLVFGKSEEMIEFEKFYEELQSKKAEKQRSKIVQGPNDIYSLTNVDSYNFEYLMTVYCGSQGTAMDVTFDTGSDWLILQSAGCPSCSGDLFDETQSSSYST